MVRNIIGRKKELERILIEQNWLLCMDVGASARLFS